MSESVLSIFQGRYTLVEHDLIPYRYASFIERVNVGSEISRTR